MLYLKKKRKHLLVTHVYTVMLVIINFCAVSLHVHFLLLQACQCKMAFPFVKLIVVGGATNSSFLPI